MKKIGKVVLWILFWYFLLPYVLLKKYVFKNAKHQKIWSGLIAGFLVLFLLAKIGSDDEDTQSDQANSTKIHYVTKKLGTKELAKQKTRAKSLEEEKSRKEKEYDELKIELADQEDKQKEKQKEKENSTKGQVHKETSTSSKSSSMSTNKKVSKDQKTTEDTTSYDSSSTTEGDLDTRETGQIVGNSKSKIYHVPGQAGYHMNSANAVYFNSEQEAIDAGYRKALR